ncbi:hypothetical protein P7L53_16000 [Thermoleptolyngbya sichuanensis XZ-Cy5]|nr:hypothetical protein [Thermoleptolyngbya sichuanensis XZ-Cy5]
MAFTAQDLAAVEAAIASGELTVTANGRTVTYRSMSDLLRARDLMKTELQQPAGPKIGGRSYALARFDCQE